MPQFKNMLILGLSAALAACAVVAWRQRGEIEQLKHRPGLALAPAVVLRQSSARHFPLPPPPRNLAPPLEDERVENFGQRLRLGGEPRTRPPEPRRGRVLAKLAANPEFLNALGVYQEGSLDARFAELFRKLNLTGEELARIKRLLAEKENAEFDVYAIGETVQDAPLSTEELRSTVREVRMQVEDELRLSLGAERYELYREYVHTLPQRTTVAQLEQRLSYSSTPLTPGQSEAMVRVLAANAAPKEAVLVAPSAVLAGTEAMESVPVVRQNAISAVVSESAMMESQHVLSAAQMDALRQIQFEQHSALRASQLIRSALPANNPPVPGWPLLFQ